MKFCPIFLLSGCLVVPSITSADAFTILERCYELTAKFEDVRSFFGSEYLPTQRIELMSHVSDGYVTLIRTLMVAGGSQTNHALVNFSLREAGVIEGSTFINPLPIETAQCKLPDGNFNCGPVHDLLDETALTLTFACKVDYEEAVK